VFPAPGTTNSAAIANAIHRMRTTFPLHIVVRPSQQLRLVGTPNVKLIWFRTLHYFSSSGRKKLSASSARRRSHFFLDSRYSLRYNPASSPLQKGSVELKRLWRLRAYR
jgi:hypothetical protein